MGVKKELIDVKRKRPPWVHIQPITHRVKYEDTEDGSISGDVLGSSKSIDTPLLASRVSGIQEYSMRHHFVWQPVAAAVSELTHMVKIAAVAVPATL